MSEHRATIRWRFTGGDFLRGRYSREHRWAFDGGVEVTGSASPAVVPLPYSTAEAVDPEEAFVAAIAACHMLTFLHLASRRGFEVASYEDEAVGTLAKNERGVPWVRSVALKPLVTYQGRSPAREEEEQLHHRAHENCFISNSVKTEIVVLLPDTD